jgi:hypothetical protein
MSTKRSKKHEAFDQMVKLVGKKLTCVQVKRTWDDSEIESVTLGVGNHSMTFTASTLKGCEECDPDGSNIDYISVRVK